MTRSPVLADCLCAWNVSLSASWLRVDSISTIENLGGPPYTAPRWKAPYAGTSGAGSGRSTLAMEPLPPIVNNQTGRLGWVRVGLGEIGVEQFQQFPTITSYASPYEGRLRCDSTPSPSEAAAWKKSFTNDQQVGSFAVNQQCYDSGLTPWSPVDRPWMETADASWIPTSKEEGPRNNGRVRQVLFVVEANLAPNSCRRARLLVAGLPLQVEQGCVPTPPRQPVEVTAIEVTQGVQNQQNEAPRLIEGRPTFARVQFRATNGERPNFTAWLRVKSLDDGRSVVIRRRASPALRPRQRAPPNVV